MQVMRRCKWHKFRCSLSNAKRSFYCAMCI